MQGKKNLQTRLFYQVSLPDLVPKDNFYRKLSQVLDLKWIYKETLHYYGKEGNESIDPVVFFKILLVGYLNNISSDRKLMEYCSNCLDIRLFLQYDIDQPLPWHSTISRTRQLYGEEVFLTLFRKVLSMCVEKGMVRGRRQAFDSAYIKANASMDSLVEKEVVEEEVSQDVETYANELNQGSEYKVSQAKKQAVERHHKWKEEAYKTQPGGANTTGQTNQIDPPVDENGNLIRPKFLSNHTHYSPTDPDSKISTKPGKARQLNYSGQIAVDDAHHVITGACASCAGQRDSQNLAEILDQTLENLSQQNITIGQIAADAGYSSGESLQYLEEKGIEGWMPNFGQYRSERAGFVYNQLYDRYECTRSGSNKAHLPFKRVYTDSKGYTKKTYRSSETNCKACPFQTQCCGQKTKFKKIDESTYKPYYDRMHERIQGNLDYAKRISRIRSKTVEPVLGTLVNFTNMKRVNTRGMQAANKHVLMAALTYNLKKYLKFNRLAIKTKSNEVGKEVRKAIFSNLVTLPGFHTFEMRASNF
jgi:transposase